MKTTPTVCLSRLGSAIAVLMLSGLLSVPWQVATAAPVTSTRAAAAVTGWLSLDHSPLGEKLGTSVLRVETFNDKAGNALYYAVYLNPAGFVIVAADDLVEPIVGFAGAGSYDPAENNPLGALVSKDLAARVAYVRQAGGMSPDRNALQAQAKWQQLSPEDGGPVITPNKLSTVSDMWVAPFVQSTWDQQTAAGAGTTACYNYYTPPHGDGRTTNYPAGCVATAMAQLMRYWQFPTAGVGSAGYPISYDGFPLTYYLHGGDGQGGPYVWGNMPLVPPSNPTTAQCQAIGALVADAGATVNMSYTAGGSSSSPSDAKAALLNTFQFANARFGWNGNNEIGANLIAMINPNLDARYPVLLGIQGAGVGHAVVADGYGTNSATLYHHLNLGWSGNATAWYSLPLIDTGVSTTFNVVDACIYNVYTNGSGEIISGRVLDQNSRPVVNATVTATRSGGGVYTTTTDTNGIYAVARIPSASSYSIAVSKANYSPATSSYSTGTSSDWAASSGNYWGANFTLNKLPTVVDHLVWSTLAATQNLNTAFGVTVTALNADNGPVIGFTGSVALSGYRTWFGSAATVIGNLGWSSARGNSAGLTDGYAVTPSTNLQVTAVRCFSDAGAKVSIWTDSGTLLASQTVSSGGWAEATLPAPIMLSAGTTYRVTGYYGPYVYSYRTTAWPTTFANGAVGQTYYTALGDNFPVQVYATAQGPLVDLRYRVASSNSVPVSPTSSGAFVNGVWSGNVTVGLVATNVVLKADDGAGHVAVSNPFNVIDPNAAPPTITTQPQSRTNNTGENATFSLVATSGATPSYYWRRNGSPIGGANASSYTLNNVQLPDSGSQFSCVVSNTYGGVTSQIATLTVICTNVVVAAKPQVTLVGQGVVSAMAVLPDGAWVIGGSFTNVNGVTRRGIARILPNGSLDTNWNPDADSSVWAIAVSDTNIYVGGAFTSIGTFSRNCLAKLSSTGTGVADAAWNPDADYYVSALAVSGTNVFAGGGFWYIGPQPRNCIAKLSATGTGSADPSWNPNATQWGYVDAIALSGTDVFIGGYFTNVSGLSRNCLARMSSSGNGAADPTWNPNANNEVFAMAVNGADVYVGGWFTRVGGQNRQYIAKLSSTGTGTADSTWNPNPDFGVWSLAARGLCVYAGGGFTNIGGLRRVDLAKLSALGTGAADAAWEADCNGDVNTMIMGSSALCIGGRFTQVAGQARPGIAALTYTPLQLLSPQRLGGGQFQATLSGERGQGFEILASSNLVDWATIATLTNSTGTTNFTDTTPGLNRRIYRARQVP